MKNVETLKTIKTREGILELSLNEVLIHFDGMAKQFAHKCCNKLCNYENNAYDYDDYYQMSLMIIMRLYEKYDLSRGACFSTLVFRELGNKQIMLMRELGSEKRKNEQPNVYLNKEIEGCEIANVVEAKADSYFEDSSKLEKYILNNLSKEEKMCIAMLFKKEVNKAKGTHKKSIEYAIDVFSENIVNLENIGKQQLAEMLNISRPTLNKKIDQAIEKVKLLAVQYIKIETA